MIQDEKKYAKKGKRKGYVVKIEETLVREVTVYEDEMKEYNRKEAEMMVSNWWQEGQIILQPEDFSEVKVNVIREVEE